MGLIFHRSGQITERTRWNLSLSGVSASSKYGRLTLNTRGRSNYRLAKGFNIRVNTVATFIIWIFIFIWKLITILLKALVYSIVFLCEGVYYGGFWLWDKVTDSKAKRIHRKEEAKPPIAESEELSDSLVRPTETLSPRTPLQSVTLDEKGVYDVKTSNSKIYEFHLTPESNFVVLDDLYGKQSYDHDSTPLIILKLRLQVGKPVKMLVRKPNGQESMVATQSVIAIAKVA